MCTHALAHRCSKLTSVGLQSIGPACTHLLQVDLSYCNRVDDTGVEAIAMNARRLQSINLTACRKVTDKGVQRVAVMCRNTLTAVCLELCVVTDVAVQTVVREVKHLADLNLGGCENVSNVGLQIVASHGSALVRLDLSGCESRCRMRVCLAGAGRVARGHRLALHLAHWPHGCLPCSSSPSRRTTRHAHLHRHADGLRLGGHRVDLLRPRAPQVALLPSVLRQGCVRCCVFQCRSVCSCMCGRLRMRLF